MANEYMSLFFSAPVDWIKTLNSLNRHLMLTKNAIECGDLGQTIISVVGDK